MADKEWPVHMKKLVNGITETAYAHNRKEEQAYAEDGWQDQTIYDGRKDTRRLLYHADGRRIVSLDDAHESKLAAQGFTRAPVAAKVAVIPSPASAADIAEGNGRMDAIEETVSGLSVDMASMKSDIAQILEALTEKRGRKKKEETEE